MYPVCSCHSLVPQRTGNSGLGLTRQQDGVVARRELQQALLAMNFHLTDLEIVRLVKSLNSPPLPNARSPAHARTRMHTIARARIQTIANGSRASARTHDCSIGSCKAMPWPAMPAAIVCE